MELAAATPASVSYFMIRAAQIFLNHSGFKAISCHKRALGTSRPHWLIAALVTPRISANAFADPAFSIANSFFIGFIL